MEEVNVSDHLVRQEKDTKVNGYDNEGFHPHQECCSEDDEASDDDRLRVVVVAENNGSQQQLSNGHPTTNGHHPTTANGHHSSPANGHHSSTANGHHSSTANGHHSATTNGSAVVVLGEGDVDSPQTEVAKPLDTRKILNGSDGGGTRVSIPEDAVIHLTSGRVKVKKGATSGGERESIPLETMLPSYEAETGLSGGGGEKAELANHHNNKNGLWSSELGNSEKLNGNSKSSSEELVGLPANSHRKCLSSDVVSETSSEQKSTGEKLYFTEESRKLCPGWRRVFVCGLILIILSVALLLGVLAATGILLAESGGKRYESSGHSSLPSIDSVSSAGHSFKPRPKVPQQHKSLLPVNSSSSLPTTLPPKVPDASHSQTIVPNALVGEFIIDENFTEDLKNSDSDGYKSLAKYIERELHGIFKRNGGMFEELRILSFSPGSIRIKFVVMWSSSNKVILSQKATEIMKSYLRKNRNSLLAYPVDLNSIHFKDVFDECRIQKGGCSFECVWDYDTLTKTCTCKQDMVLLTDGKSCGPKPLTRSLETVTPNIVSWTPSATASEQPSPSTKTPGQVTQQTDKALSSTTPIPLLITKAIFAITDLFNNITSIDSSTEMNEFTTAVQNFSAALEFSSSPETTTESYSSAKETTTIGETTFGVTDLKTIDETTAEIATVTESSLPLKTEIDSILNESSRTDSGNNNFTHSLETTVSNLETETTTVKPPTSTPSYRSPHVEPLTTVSSYTDTENESAGNLPITEVVTVQEDISTIGYHIKEPTTEIYTLKEGTDSAFSPEFNDTTEGIPATVLEHETGSTLTTEMPSATEIPTETTKMTEINNITTGITTAGKELEYFTGLNNAEDNFTETVTLKIDDIPTTEVPTESVTDFTVPEITSNETNDSGQSTTTSVPTVLHSFNKTPEVRSIDEDFENDTLAPSTDFFSTEKWTIEPSTEGNGTSDSVEILLTTNPVTTTLPTFVTGDETLLATTTNQPISTEAAKHTITKLLSVTLNVTTDESTLEVTSAFRNTEVEGTTQTLPEISTDRSEPSSLNHGLTDDSFQTTTVMNEAEINISLLNETNITTFLLNETEITTLLPIETGLETLEVSEKTESVFNASVTNPDDMQTTTAVPLLNTNLENNTFNFTDYNVNTSTTTMIENFTENTTVGIATMRMLPDVDETTNLGTEMTIPSSEATETIMNFFTETPSDTVETTAKFLTEASSDTAETTVNTFTEMAGHLPKINETTSAFDQNSTTDIFETTFSDFENVTHATDAESLITDTEFFNSSATTNNTESRFLQTTTSTTVDIQDNMTTPGSLDLTTVTLDARHFNETESTETPENETISDFSNSTDLNEYTTSADFNETYTAITIQDFSFPSPPTNESETYFTTTPAPKFEIYGNGTLLPEDLDSNFTQTVNMTFEDNLEGLNETFFGANETSENSTFYDGNFTTTDGYDVTNETTTNVSAGIECREDQFFCEPTNTCINDTFMCDGIEDCPDGQDEFQCKDTCYSNFMCGNSSTCIMSDARCDGIWDCENGTDEENCTPTECAKHEVMCLDGSKCIKPGHICDWKYNCLDRSDEVGCIERTTCESSGRFFCNDGLCIPWSLKCDGEHDCKEGEDEGNCTCLNDEFQCEDGKCLKSSSRCDGHQDCHDADDEMGCVTIDDAQHVVSTYEPYSGTWGLLCAEDWNLDDGQYLCQELGFGHALSVDRVHVSFNGTWMAMRRENLTEYSLWTERVSFVESCTSGLAAAVECQKFACGDFSGLLHRRRRDVISTGSTQWPFIGYTSTFYSSKGCLSEILTPIWLITSAECLLSISKEPFNGSDWYVRTNLGKDVERDLAQNHEVLRIITHPHSSKFRSLTLRDYDVALVRLKHALVFVSDKIGAICPPREQVPPGITCFAGVLGTEKPRAPPPQVLAINGLALQIQDKRNCNRIEHYNNAVNQRMLCTQSSEGHTICDNDEGTPLMCLTGINEWFLAGMLTYQRYCDVYSKHPAVFSNLFPMKNFLDKVIAQKQYEVPYDSNVYVIIPPTTPSPTMPETTTTEMVTFTTDVTLMDVTDFILENGTETVSEDLNGTTLAGDELTHEEYFTSALPPDEYADNNSTETTTVSYATKFSALNTTLAESERSETESAANQTHDYMTSTLNDTFSSDEVNVTNTSVADDRTQYSDATLSHLLETSNTSAEFRNLPISFELNDTTTEPMNETDVTATTSTDLNATDVTTLMSTDFNPTEVPTAMITDLNVTDVPTAMMTDLNVTDDSTAFNPNLNVTDSTAMITDLNVTDVTTAMSSNLMEVTTVMNTDLDETSAVIDDITTENLTILSSYTEEPLISILNESLEMLRPMIVLTNKSMAMSQPLISLMDEDIEMDTENATDSRTSESLIYDAEAVTDITSSETLRNDTETSTDSLTSEPLRKRVEAATEYSTTSEQLRNNPEVATDSNTSEPLRNDDAAAATVYSPTSEPFRNGAKAVTDYSTTLEPFINGAEAAGDYNTTSKTFINDTDYSTTLEPFINGAEVATDYNTTSKPIRSDAEARLLEVELNDTMYVSMTTEDTTAAFASKTELITEIEVTSQPFAEETETFTFDLEGEPDADLAFSIFKDADGLKFESYALMENDSAGNNSENVTHFTEAEENTNATANVSERSGSHLTTQTYSGTASATTKKSDWMSDDASGNFNATSESILIDSMNYTVPVNLEADTQSSSMNESLNTETLETTTDALATKTGMIPLQNPAVLVNVETETPSNIVNESVHTENYETTTGTLETNTETALLKNPTMPVNSEAEIQSNIGNESLSTENSKTVTDNVETKTETAPLENPTVPINLKAETELSTVNVSVNTENRETTSHTLGTKAETALLENPTSVNLGTVTQLSTVNENYETTTQILETKTETALLENPTSVNLGTVTQSSTVNENYETTTQTSETEINMAPLENSTMGKLLISEESTPLPTSNLLLNSTDCGVWSERSSSPSDTTDLFLKWPALGYLQMVSEHKKCPTTVVSSQFVITSLNCLTFSSTDLDPNKWSYVGGSQPSGATSDGMQSHGVNQIIPYPGASLWLNEYDVALVRLEGDIQMNEYSKSACLAKEEVTPGGKCFTAGWNRNYSGGDQEKPFYSIPLTIISSEECNSTTNYNGMLIEDLICGTGEKEVRQECYMEYGSPLFCLDENNHWEVQGILNLPVPCSMPQPPAFSSIANLRRWIVEILENEKLPQ